MIDTRQLGIDIDSAYTDYTINIVLSVFNIYKYLEQHNFNIKSVKNISTIISTACKLTKCPGFSYRSVRELKHTSDNECANGA